ncbi:hypothetical protein [Tenacibaculum amylolyticum]|uniref:hypothetical protein n=1 Tax=Tenacibaculum amylolyticum TaxID=104269 RepID=UPI003894E870
MKKFLATTFILVILFSCSNDDNTGNANDPILGKWFLFSNNALEASDCEKRSFIEFKSDGSTVSETYQEINTSCTNTISGNDKWENKGEGLYSFNNIESQIQFLDDNMTMRVSSGNIVYKKEQ